LEEQGIKSPKDKPKKSFEIIGGPLSMPIYVIKSRLLKFLIKNISNLEDYFHEKHREYYSLGKYRRFKLCFEIFMKLGMMHSNLSEIFVNLKSPIRIPDITFPI
jgi:hypothetical protein